LQHVPAALFLEQARYALALRKIVTPGKYSHLHATSSRSLACSLLLKKLFGYTVSVTIEPSPALPRTALKDALRQCDGGRIPDLRLVRRSGRDFSLERPNLFSRFLPRDVRKRIKLDHGEKYWQEWAQRL